MQGASSITAVLGPTNTGKTHRAVERMLEHGSGMIGLPLRLLAREVYDRVTTRIGEGRVALVTGEEKRIPRSADYWVCTVEAMPIDREVDFLAVDEIQLAAHDQRGHVFTERLLSARGRLETWFMGADTMESLVRDLLPTARRLGHPRLSRLADAGAAKLARLPARSAVVCFSTQEVYDLADRVRRLRGGAAVVLGALSPRTRNAQVALYQSGEVDYLVATDAIGMGLNLDVSHVAFASLRKFDGRAVRGLEAAELAQIAGRAGRYLADGSFGTLLPLRLSPETTAAIESHRFPAVRRLWWRSTDLDRSSIDALLASLRQRPRLRCLRLAEDADDTAALAGLARDPSIRARARGAEAVGLLWEVARIPDYKKLLTETHVALLTEIFEQLAGRAATLDVDWVAERVAEIDHVAGDIDALTARIAAIRTWTYVSHQARWLRGAAEWQGRTRAIEDRLSDALHDRLVQRFVERGAARRAPAARTRRARPVGPDAADTPADASHPFARLAALRATLGPAPAEPEPDAEEWVEALVGGTHDRFSVDAIGHIRHEGRLVGQLTRGASLLLPDVRLAALPELGAGARSRVLRRLVACARDLADILLAPLRAPPSRELSAAGRGLVYQLEQGLGTLLSGDACEQIAELGPRDHEILGVLDVEVGQRVLYVRRLLRRPAIEHRLALCAAHFDAAARPVCTKPGVVSVAVPATAHPRAYAAIGYPVFGTRAIRADVAERVHRSLAESGEAGPEPARLASWIGCPAREVQRITAALAVR